MIAIQEEEFDCPRPDNGKSQSKESNEGTLTHNRLPWLTNGQPASQRLAASANRLERDETNAVDEVNMSLQLKRKEKPS